MLQAVLATAGVVEALVLQNVTVPVKAPVAHAQTDAVPAEEFAVHAVVHVIVPAKITVVVALPAVALV